MPFGLTNAPSTFQATMNQLFSHFQRPFVIVFLMISSSIAPLSMIISSTWNWCLLVYKIASFISNFLSVNFESIEYLGHIVSAKGVHADPSKLVAMEKWPIPVSVKQLRGFLGLTCFYRRFIAHYASIAAPLIDLLHHNSFCWSEEATTAFLALKQAMMAAPVLVFLIFPRSSSLKRMRPIGNWCGSNARRSSSCIV